MGAAKFNLTDSAFEVFSNAFEKVKDLNDSELSFGAQTELEEGQYPAMIADISISEAKSTSNIIVTYSVELLSEYDEKKGTNRVHKIFRKTMDENGAKKIMQDVNNIIQVIPRGANDVIDKLGECIGVETVLVVTKKESTREAGKFVYFYEFASPSSLE